MLNQPTPDWATDWGRARWDIDFFSSRFLGISPHDGQSSMFDTALKRMPNGWQAAYLTICISAGNRAGKTLGLAILVLHSTVYKMGLPLPDPNDPGKLRTWQRASYDWYHFGIQQETAELVHVEIVRILTGIHEAQRGAGCPLVDELGPEVIDFTTKDRGVYLLISVHPALGGGQIHFRTTAEKALGSLGKDMNGISFDECAFDPALEFVVHEVLHFRRLGTGGQLFLISTSTEGLTAFSDLWFLGDPDAPDRLPDAMSLKISTRQNIGYGLDQDMFDRLVAGMPEYLIEQNIDGGFIEARKSFFSAQAVDAAFIADWDDEVQPVRGHRYAHGVDPALTYDSTWGIVLDMTDPRKIRGVRARRKSGRQTTLSVSHLIHEGHRLYSGQHFSCSTALDATGFGGAAFQDLVSDIHPFRAIGFGGTRGKKLKLLLDTKKMLEEGRLRFPRTGIWLALRRQLLGYQLEDRKLDTDAVMALAVACSIIVRNSRGAAEDTTFDYFGAGRDAVPSAERVLGRIAQRLEDPVGGLG